VGGRWSGIFKDDLAGGKRWELFGSPAETSCGRLSYGHFTGKLGKDSQEYGYADAWKAEEQESVRSPFLRPMNIGGRKRRKNPGTEDGKDGKRMKS